MRAIILGLIMVGMPIGLVGKTVGVVLPMEHVALREIVSGFKEELKKEGGGIEVVVQNAGGDMNLMRSILLGYQRRGVDIIVPVGMVATQMAAGMEKERPVVGFAAKVSGIGKQGNLTGLEDEIEARETLEFMLKVKPGMKKVVVLHSASEKVMPEVKAIEAFGVEKGIGVKRLMVGQLMELGTQVKHIDEDTDFVLVLKDHLIVSGMRGVSEALRKRGLLLVASDEGSVKNGAVMAVGVRERSIGEEGAKLVSEVMKGERRAGEIEARKLKELEVFVNVKGSEHLKIDVKKIEAVAWESGYGVILM